MTLAFFMETSADGSLFLFAVVLMPICGAVGWVVTHVHSFFKRRKDERYGR